MYDRARDPQADESLDSRRYVIYFRSQYVDAVSVWRFDCARIMVEVSLDNIYIQRLVRW